MESSPTVASAPPDKTKPAFVPGRKKSRRRYWWLLLLLLLVAGGVGATLYRKREVPLVVQTEKAARRNLTEMVVATGRIQPVLQVKISPEVSGEIIELPVKEGQLVKKGDLILKIKPDFYIANTNSAHASLMSTEAGKSLAQANLNKAAAELKRFKTLNEDKLVSESVFFEVQTSWEVARAQHQSAVHQAEMARAALARAEEELAKTTIYAPLDGTVSKLNSQRGERVVGTATMAGTEVMTIAQLDDMEARVDIGEVDIVLIALGQRANLEVDSFRDRKFTGRVYEIANSAKTTQPGQQQEATKFEVKIRIDQKEPFLPGMSVTAEVETRYRTNVLCVPIQCVTTRVPAKAAQAIADRDAEDPTVRIDPREGKGRTNSAPREVVFTVKNNAAEMLTVVRGISDATHVEIKSGLEEGIEVVSGSYKAINRELEQGKRVTVGPPPSAAKTKDS